MVIYWNRTFWVGVYVQCGVVVYRTWMLWKQFIVYVGLLYSMGSHVPEFLVCSAYLHEFVTCGIHANLTGLVYSLHPTLQHTHTPNNPTHHSHTSNRFAAPCAIILHHMHLITASQRRGEWPCELLFISCSQYLQEDILH